MTIPAGSRYEQADKNFTMAHLYDEFGHPVLSENLTRLQYLVVAREATYLLTVLPLPPPGMAQYYVKDSEHMPFLAYKFLQDSTRWWELAEANTQIWHPLDMRMGSFIQIPS